MLSAVVVHAKSPAPTYSRRVLNPYPNLAATCREERDREKKGPSIAIIVQLITIEDYIRPLLCSLEDVNQVAPRDSLWN
jgi:hypothetical protein